MIRTLAPLIVLFLSIPMLATGTIPQEQRQRDADNDPNPAFLALDVIIDTGSHQLAAYQLEFNGLGNALLVGIEGGEHASFSAPPTYDPAALQQSRVILADLNTGTDLPSGRTRIARLHLMLNDPAQHEHTIRLHTALDPAGNAIDAAVTTIQTEGTN